MAINRVEIKDFLVFKGEFATGFCAGVNVIIGGNATGKTTLLKAMYRLCGNGKNSDTGQFFFTNRVPFSPFNRPFEYLRLETLTGDTGTRICVRNAYCDGPTPDNSVFINGTFVGYNPNEYIEEYTNSKPSNYSRMSTDLVFVSENYKALPSVFIPSTNLLPHSRGLVEMIDAYEMDFDITQVEILRNARRPVTKSPKLNCGKVIDGLTKTIGGEVVYDEGSFYLEKTNGEKVEFALEASGFTRLGLLWKLLRNGLLESGTILFWDEPENSLNPDLVPILVDVLLELSRNGVQIFLATHSEILASYFSVNREKGDVVMFYSLYKEGEHIKADKSDRFDLLVPNNLTLEPVRLYERKLERGSGGNGQSNN